MKKNLSLMIVTVVLVLGPAAAFLDTAAPKGPAIRTVHLFSPGSVHDERLLLSLLQEFNATLARLGYPEVRYRLWRAEGTEAGKPGLMYESTGPNREVYDRAHKEKEYVSLLEKYLPFLQRVLEGEAYTIYAGIDSGPGGKKGGA